MEITVELKAFKERLDPLIGAYFDSVLKNPDRADDLVDEALGHARDIILSGGKRLRSALMYHAYLGMGGTEEEKILKTSVSIELIHAFLLTHDDIIDRDDIRHGVPTLQKRYADFGRRHFPHQDVNHFGTSIALIMGDMLYAFGNDIIFRSDFPKDVLFQALSCLQGIISFTVVGQARDIYMEYKRDATEDEILKMYQNKTAKYTIEGPLHLGAILAGASQELLTKLSAYALPLGIAFQIQDDILGLFGTEERIGKPVGSDIEEGKFTLLVARTLKNVSMEQRKRLREILDRGAELTDADRQEFCDLIRTSGSLQEVQVLAQEYIATSRQALKELKPLLTEQSYLFLNGITDYMTKREY